MGEEPYPQIPPNGKWLSPKFKKSEIGIFKKQNEFSPQNKIWGIRLKSRWLRAVKNHSKASKIHSSGDMRLEHKKGKVRKTDGWKLGESSP